MKPHPTSAQKVGVFYLCILKKNLYNMFAFCLLGIFN